MSFRIARFTVLCLLLPLCLQAHIGDAPPDPELAPVRTKHYQVVSEAGTNAALRAAQDLEILREEFLETFAGKLRVAADGGPYRALLLKGPKALPYAGLYDPVRGVAAVSIAKNRWPAGQLTSTLRHEGAHQLFDKALRIPVIAGGGSFWYREGLACYFEGSGRFRLNGTVRLMRLGTLEAAYRNRVLPDVDTLLRLGAGDQAGSVDYALVWSFVHFLMHGEKGAHRDAFFGFLGNLQQWNRSGRGSEAFAASFPDLNALHRGWVEHVILLQRGQQVDFDRSLAPVGERPHKGPVKVDRDYIPKLEADHHAAPTAAEMRARYKTLASVLAGPDAEWAERARRELFADPAGLRELVAGFGKVDRATQEMVLTAIARAEERAALPFLIETSLRHADPELRRRAATLVGTFHYGMAPKVYFDFMRGQGPAAMHRVAEALEVIGDRHAIKYLVAVLSQVGHRVGAAAGERGPQPLNDGNEFGSFGDRRTFKTRRAGIRSQLPKRVLGRDEAEEQMAYAVMKALRTLSGEDAGSTPGEWMSWLETQFRRR